MPVTFSLTDLITFMMEIYGFIIGLFADFVNVITGNMLLLFPVAMGLLAGAIFLVFKIIRKLGIRRK